MKRPKEGLVTRRDFIRGTAFTTLGFALGLSPFAFSQQNPSSVKKKTTVVLVRDEKAIQKDLVSREVVSGMLNQGISSLFETAQASSAWKMLFSAEDTVGIKITLMMTPIHDELIKAMVDNLLSAGVKDENIYVWDRDEIGQGRAEIFTRPKRMGYENHLNRVVKKCTALINVCGMKAHWLSGVALSIKNWCGAIDNAYTYHTEDCCASLGALLKIPEIESKSRLIIVDALKPLFHGGPQIDPKYLWNYNGLLLGIDHVAVDTVALKIIQAKRDKFQGKPWILSPPPAHIALADTKYKRGTSDLHKIDIVKLGWQKDVLI